MPELFQALLIAGAAAAFGAITTEIARHILKVRKGRKAQEEHPLRRLLNFGDDEIVFVFSRRENIRPAILPRTSTEDFLAINNLITAFLTIGLSRKLRYKDTKKLLEAKKLNPTPDDYKRNLILICSAKTNEVTREFLEKLSADPKIPDIFRFEQTGNPDEWRITSKKHGSFHSKTFDQIREYEAQGKTVEEQALDDVAIIAKVTNPWKPSNKILIVAGVRGVGTWGAAELIKKEYDRLYKAKKGESDGFRKDGDFSAVVNINFENCDIKGWEVIQLIDIT